MLKLVDENTSRITPGSASATSDGDEMQGMIVQADRDVMALALPLDEGQVPRGPLLR